MQKSRKTVEPNFETPLSETGLLRALQWYNINSNSKKSKSYLVSYLRSIKSPMTTTIEKHVHESQMINTCGYVARLLGRGIEIPEGSLEYFKKGVKEIYDRGLELKEETDNAPPQPIPQPKPKIPQLDMKFGEVLHEIDEYINSECKKSDFRIKKWLAGHRLNKKYAKSCANEIQKEVDFINGALDGDKELREAYSVYNKPSLRRLGKFLEGMVNDCLEYAKPAPRRKKVKI